MQELFLKNNDKSASDNKSSVLNKDAGDKKDTFSIQAPQINLPKGGGAIKSIDEKFSVNAVNGTSSFNLPIPFSQARGFSPSLMLNYNSGSGNGLFGLGWTLSLSSIKRKTENELPEYFDDINSDTFIFSGAEDLVPEFKRDADDNLIKDSDCNFIIKESPVTFQAVIYDVRRYRPRIEGLFSRIERWTEKNSGFIHWRIISKDNTTAVYGKSASARIADPRDAKRIFEWLPEFTYDDKGNCAVYEFKAEDGFGTDKTKLHNKNRLNGNALISNTYLKRIKYGNVTPFKTHTDPVPAQFLFETVFDYGEHDTAAPPYNEIKNWDFRADAFSFYKAGFEIRTCRTCKRILLFHHFTELPGGSALVKSLDFKYSNNEQNGFTFLTEALLTGYTKHDDGTYTQKSLPPFAFEYQKHEWNNEIKTIQQEDLLHAPAGIDGSNYQFVDLYNEGVAGILTEQSNAWFYKTNLGDGHFTAAKVVAQKPSFAGLPVMLQLVDLEANGVNQLVNWQQEPKGYFELSPGENWEPFKPFEEVPEVNFNDANTRRIDLNGDGMADVFISEQDVFRWYTCKGKKGFSASVNIAKSKDEEQGPAIVFADGTQTIFLADMSGSGITDIVRIRNGEVCYWPQLGNGKFGAKVSMDDAPFFDHPDKFNPQFIKLADIEGSGTTDIIYYGKNEFYIWLNQHGNSFLQEPVIIEFPETDNQTKISVIDLLGTGMACIVWNNVLSKHQQAPLRYIDLMNSKKPHIMTAYKNNMGREVFFEYKPSTQFYLQDKKAGNPWITKIHFPVHCVSKVVTYDRILKTRFASEYTYHHGYYDHLEKEFRGFGRVDQTDAEDIIHFIKQGEGAANAVVEQDLHQPPVLTKTWFHTGAFLDRKKILNQFTDEYSKHTVASENLLPEPALEDTLSTEEYRQALRACKGMLLRKEVYALDDDPLKKDIPYQVEQHNCLIKILQPKENNRYGVFLVQESEAITYHYERNPDDRRVAHSFIVEVDKYGNVLQQANVAYGRKPLPGNEPEQEQMHITLTENSFTNDIQKELDYRSPLTYITQSYEITGIPKPANYFKLRDLKTNLNSAAVIDHHVAPTNGIQKRIIDWVRIEYLNDDAVTTLPSGSIDSKGLVHQSYKAVMHQGMLSDLFSEKIALADLKAILIDPSKGAYIFSDDYFWLPSGTQNYETQHFYLSTKFKNAFGKITTLEYDNNYFLFIKKATDAAGNESKVKKFNYRTLSPHLIQDMNDNATAVRFDEFGMVVKSFMIGKKGIDKGDEFDETKVEMKDAVDFPSSQLQYEFLEWFQQTQSPGFDPAQYKPKPCYSKTHTRETHHHAHPLHESKFNNSYTYYDGGGKVVLTKNQAEPGPALQVNADGTITTIPDTAPNLRWVGNGRTILNNKGNPIKQYEPYFSTSLVYDDEKEMVELGVTVVTHYDPLGRNIRTDFPNKTFASVEFTTWQQKLYDANDNVKKSLWYLNHGSPDPSEPEPVQPDVRAAWLAAKHDDTPAISYLDSLGRTFLTIADNGTDKIDTRIKYDIQGKELEVKDGMQRKVMEYHYNLLGNIVKQISIDAGSRWTIVNAASKPLLSWDDRNHEFGFTYDDLNKLTTSTVKAGNAAPVVFGKIEYGETLPLAAAKAGNLRGAIHILFEQSGITTNVSNDFKGNLLQSTRQLTATYKEIINWNNPAAVTKEPEIFENSTEYDALNRPVKLVTPHTAGMQPSEFFPIYNEAGMLDKMEVAVRGAGRTAFVTKIDYNAKGRRQNIFYNNGTKTKYEYYKETFLLKRIFTTRHSDNKVLQDLNYTHDPAGNITGMNDASQADVFFDGERVKALNQYEYNALYQLIKATGRKHAGMTDISHTKADFNYRNQPFVNSASINPNDAQAFRNYTEQYKYDKAGNMLEQKHVSKNSGWTRTFEYTHGNNQLSKTEVGPFQMDYTYDAHGNLNAMEHLQQMVWNYMDHLSQVDLGGGGKAFYVYNSSGQRVRKVIERLDGTKAERIYLGAIEIFRVKNSAGTTVQERETLHIMDDNKTIAMVDTPVIKPAGSAQQELTRYNYDNHLGSATIELDNNALQISYEEYFPFGTTSYSTLDATREVPAKRYRYTGKERDEETGLNYHGARYYAMWLCRWTAADPTGIGDGLNVFVYAKQNPLNILIRMVRQIRLFMIT